MTSIPYPTFTDNTKVKQNASLSAVGRCRIYLDATNNPSYSAILHKCVEQAAVDPANSDDKDAAKKLQKKYMKQGVAMASEYIQQTLGLDVSIVDVEVHVVDANDVIVTDGCIASCFLDAGCARIVLTTGPLLQDAIQTARIPRERLAVHFQSTSESSDSDKFVEQLRDLIAQVQTDCDVVSVQVDTHSDPTLLSNLLSAAKDVNRVDVVVQLRCMDDPSFAEAVGTALKATPSNTSGTTISLLDPTASQLGQSYAACLKTDRMDKLYTTVVCTRTGEALGLVYSSVESIVAALDCGRGVYYSRSRQSLWRKGDTSGHYQTLHRIDVDCDGDAVRFTVTQRNTETSPGAFCHLETLTCWGPPRGLRHLEATLQERLKAAPVGSYTKRLFDDENLLREKLVEEAQELAEADTSSHVAEEFADVLYFAMVRAAKFGVSIDDAVAELDRRTRKVTRRAGDSKAFRTEAAQLILDKAKNAE